MTEILREDLRAISDSSLKWQKLKDSSVLVTGATGLIGSLIINSICFASEKHALNVTVYAAVRDIEAAQKLFENFNVKYIAGDICEICCNEKLDYIIHCAAVTKSFEMIKDPVGNIKAAVNGTQNILEIARARAIKSMVYISSMEVYGIADAAVSTISEDMLGFVDLKSPRSCYPEGKRMCELLCNCYLSQYGIPVKIARLAQTFGAGVSKSDNRVFAQFAKSAVSGADIVMHTNGMGVGNYCYTADAVRGIILIMLEGENGEAYNVANERSAMTIRDMAQLVAREISGGKISVVFETLEDDSHGYAPPVSWKLSTDKIKSLGWCPEFTMIDNYKRMIEDWSEQA